MIFDGGNFRDFLKSDYMIFDGGIFRDLLKNIKLITHIYE